MNKALIKKCSGALSLLNRCLPKSKTKIVFYSNMGFRDNVKAVYDELLRQDCARNYQIVCAVNDYEAFAAKPHPDNVTFTSPAGGVRHFLTGRYFFYSFGKYPIKPSKSQMVMNVWHGSPLKKIGAYLSDEDQNFFTVLLAASDFFVPVMQRAFACRPEQIQVCGHPRNDAMFLGTDALQKLGFSGYHKLILWLPTFRQSSFLGDTDTAASEGTGLPILSSPADMARVNQLLQEQHALLLAKIHPAQDLNTIDRTSYSNLAILTNAELSQAGVDLYELLGQADGLITDYSSVYFDYLLLNRPIGFTVDDLAEYEKNRGFVVDDPRPLMPGPFLNTPDEFAAFIDDLLTDRDEYEADRIRVGKLANRYPGGQDAARALRIAGILSPERGQEDRK